MQTTNIKKPTHSVLCVGSVTVDIITLIADQDIELLSLHNRTSSFLMLEQGKKVESENIASHVGGGAANTAVCMSRLGMQVDILALVGNDHHAEKIVARLKEEGVGLSYLHSTDSVGTGVAVHISSHDRNAAIFNHRGANCLLTSEQVEAVDYKQYGLVYVTNLSKQSTEHYPQLIQQAAQAGCFVASNPGMRQITKLCDQFLGSLGSVNFLSLNKVECGALLPSLIAAQPPFQHSTAKVADNKPPLLASGLQFGGLSMELVACMTCIASYGPDYVVITDGGAGAYLWHKSQLYYCPPEDVVMCGSAGAGDSFSSTLASMIYAGNTLECALSAASLNAASVIAYVDTQEGLLSFDKLTDAIKVSSVWSIEFQQEQ